MHSGVSRDANFSTGSRGTSQGHDGGRAIPARASASPLGGVASVRQGSRGGGLIPGASAKEDSLLPVRPRRSLRCRRFRRTVFREGVVREPGLRQFVGEVRRGHDDEALVALSPKAQRFRRSAFDLAGQRSQMRLFSLVARDRRITAPPIDTATRAHGRNPPEFTRSRRRRASDNGGDRAPAPARTKRPTTTQPRRFNMRRKIAVARARRRAPRASSSRVVLHQEPSSFLDVGSAALYVGRAAPARRRFEQVDGRRAGASGRPRGSAACASVGCGRCLQLDEASGGASNARSGCAGPI